MTTFESTPRLTTFSSNGTLAVDIIGLLTHDGFYVPPKSSTGYVGHCDVSLLIGNLLMRSVL
jgi:hypothetical protein